MAFLCQYILNINCLWKFLSKIVLFIAYLGFLLSQTVSIPIFSSRTEFATLTPWIILDLLGRYIFILPVFFHVQLFQIFYIYLSSDYSRLIRKLLASIVMKVQSFDFSRVKYICDFDNISP